MIGRGSGAALRPKVGPGQSHGGGPGGETPEAKNEVIKELLDVIFLLGFIKIIK